METAIIAGVSHGTGAVRSHGIEVPSALKNFQSGWLTFEFFQIDLHYLMA